MAGIFSLQEATFEPGDLDIVQNVVKALGLIPKLSLHILDRYGYLAGQDKDRAVDLNQIFADLEVAAILPIRGGWGCSRLN